MIIFSRFQRLLSDFSPAAVRMIRLQNLKRVKVVQKGSHFFLVLFCMLEGGKRVQPCKCMRDYSDN